MRANMQAAKLGYTSSACTTPTTAAFPPSVHAPQPLHPGLDALGYSPDKPQPGDEETKVPLIQRLLVSKLGCADPVGAERDMVSEAMGHLCVPSSAP
jgi:hypothetical protein